MNLDGSVPDDNPFPNSLVYTFGNRNSQGLALGPNGIIYSSEHGQNSNDEFNIVTSGGNYGWPNVEGFCNTSAEQTFCADNDVVEPLEAWSPCIAVNGIEFYNHEAIPEWQNSVLMSVLGGLGGQYERLSVLHLSEDGLSVTSEDQYFSSFNQRVRDVAVNPNTGSVYVALNGTSYPGSGPNIIKEFRNDAYGTGVAGWNSSEFELGLFPNPASAILNLSLPAGTRGTFEITGYNGQRMLEGNLQGSLLSVPVSNWSEGSYFVQIRHQGGTITRTFQVQR
jgi:aldose sugar dehydrogenase